MQMVSRQRGKRKMISIMRWKRFSWPICCDSHELADVQEIRKGLDPSVHCTILQRIFSINLNVFHQFVVCSAGNRMI